MLDIIRNNNPLLIVYPAGAGGEFISKTIANNSPSFNNLEYVLNELNNQIHAKSIVRYSSMWRLPDVDTIIDFNVFNNIDLQLKNVIKDHPSLESCDLYKKYIPTSEILYISPIKELLYFCKLAYVKLAELIPTPISNEYFLTKVNKNITKEEKDIIRKLTNPFPKVWRHEIDILNTKVSYNKEINIIFKHEHNLSDAISRAIKGIETDDYLKNVMPVYKKNFKKFMFINTDELTISSNYFWLEIKKIIPDINVHSAITSTDKWIKKNNKLLEICNSLH